MTRPDLSDARMAKRAGWLIGKMSERSTPDGRTVLELVEAPLWIEPDGLITDYINAIDAAMASEDAHRE